MGVAGAIIAIVASMATFVGGGFAICRDVLLGRSDGPLPKEGRVSRSTVAEKRSAA